MPCTFWFFCILYTKYYIYIKCIFNKNELDFYACLAQVKLALEIEYNICKTQTKKKTFKKLNLYMATYNKNNSIHRHHIISEKNCQTGRTGEINCQTARTGKTNCQTTRTGQINCQTARTGQTNCQTRTTGHTNCQTGRTGQTNWQTARTWQTNCQTRTTGQTDCQTRRSPVVCQTICTSYKYVF